MPRGKAHNAVTVLVGQSMFRPTRTASPLSAESTRLQAVTCSLVANKTALTKKHAKQKIAAIFLTQFIITPPFDTMVTVLSYHRPSIFFMPGIIGWPRNPIFQGMISEFFGSLHL
jgi:hypothetical protein